VTPDVEALRAELKALQASWEYAFAMGHGCSVGDHPRHREVRERAADLAARIADTRPECGPIRSLRFNDAVTERLRAELDAATAELKAHMASWEYAYAMAGGAHGGREHPRHEQTRERTEFLRTRCRDLRARLAEHEL
jgi:hypothetical protein